MKKRPLIGVSGSHDGEKRQIFVRENYMDCVLAAGGIPVLLPYVGDEASARAMLSSLDGLMLAGGVDIDPAHFGEAKLEACGEIDEKRDAFELLITPMAIEMGMPVFGICRGIQTLAVALGGTLVQDIESQMGIPAVTHQQNPPYTADTHEVRFEAGGLLARITGKTRVRVNSMHHQSVKALGDRLRLEGLSGDGVIEAVSMKGREDVFGVQYHPEYIAGEHAHAAKLFAHFVACAEAYRNRKD